MNDKAETLTYRMYDALADALGPAENEGHQDGVQAIGTLVAQRDATQARVTELETQVGIMRDALDAAAYVCEGVAKAPDRPETVAPGYARSVAKQCRRALSGPDSRKFRGT